MSEFEINEEFAKANNLTTEQVTAIKGSVTTYHTTEVAELKKGWDGKANDDAQGILTGAAKSITDITGIERTNGEKIADFISRSWEGHSTTKTAELTKSKADYDEKLKNFKGDEATAAELLKTQESLDVLMLKTKDYDTLKDSAEKLTPLQEQYDAMKKRVAWGGVKPNFPDTINEYEAGAKWSECIANIEKEYTIEFDGDKAVGVNKENKHNILPLKDLVGKDETITKLMEGRQQTGANGKQTELQKIEGVPFDVPKDANSAKRAELISIHLASKGVGNMSPEYPKLFAELNSKMLQQTA